MIVDTSAILAILFAEGDAPLHARHIERADVCRVSAANWLEAAIRVDLGGSPVAASAFDDFIEQSGIRIEPVTVEHARRARAAYRAFGKGTGHPARLNFGDCFSYALAKTLREPLLFKGHDFGKTDVETVALSSEAESTPGDAASGEAQE
jgi:ribonuclease VapC